LALSCYYPIKVSKTLNLGGQLQIKSPSFAATAASQFQDMRSYLWSMRVRTNI